MDTACLPKAKSARRKYWLYMPFFLLLFYHYSFLIFPPIPLPSPLFFWEFLSSLIDLFCFLDIRLSDKSKILIRCNGYNCNTCKTFCQHLKFRLKNGTTVLWIFILKINKLKYLYFYIHIFHASLHASFKNVCKKCLPFKISFAYFMSPRVKFIN